MTSKFDIQRAVLDSDLTTSARMVMVVLLDHAGVDPVNIPAKFSPSLTTLARKSGLCRSTVCSILAELESQGWITRGRPPVEQSRKHVRTRYRLAVPVGAHGTYPDTKASPLTGLAPDAASPLTGLELVRSPDQAGPLTGLELVRSPDPSNQPVVANQSNLCARADDETAAVIEAVRDVTGRTIDQNFAKLVIKNVLGNGDSERPGVKDRVGYLVKSIRNDPNPATRFLPTGQPPPVHEVLGTDPPPRKDRTVRKEGAPNG